MSDYSGIDSAAFQKMVSSFKSDKGSLRSAASTYKTEFSRYGLDTSHFTELTGIASWMDDQTPSLDRRYHLAIAAEQPYPGHKGMVQIDESMVGTTAQSIKDGKSLADQFNSALKKGDEPSEDLYAQLSEHADDPDYLKAFYNQLGPGNLMMLTNDMADDNFYGRYGDHPDQALHDRDILAKTFGTFTKVAFEGQSSAQKQKSWDKWFDGFSDPNRKTFRADYLTSLLPGGSQDKDFLVALGDRVFDKDPQKSGSEYMGADGMNKGEFGKDHLTQLFDAISTVPEASGEWMDHNYDTLQKIIYPGMVNPMNEPQSRADALVKVMHSGTIELRSTNEDLAEQLTARIMMDNYRHQNGDASSVHPFDPIDYYYSQLITAYWPDMVNGITSPTADKLWGGDATAGGFTQQMSQWDKKAFLAGQDPNRPGLEVGAPLWQALLNESARDPKAAGEESALFDAYRNKIDQTRAGAQDRTPEHAQDYLSMQRGLMMKAYSKAFDYAEGSIEGDAQTWADGVNSARATLINGAYDAAVTAGSDGVGAAVTGVKDNLVGTAQDTAKTLLTGWLTDALSVKPEDAPGGLADKYKKIDGAKLDTGWQDEYRRLANDQLNGGGFDPKVTAPVTIYPRKGKPVTYTGNPKTYITGPADNFLNKDGSVKDIGSMTNQQRTAYDKWLQDPAVVSKVEHSGFTQGTQFQNIPDE
jgi:hypothetical protein